MRLRLLIKILKLLAAAGILLSAYALYAEQDLFGGSPDWSLLTFTCFGVLTFLVENKGRLK